MLASTGLVLLTLELVKCGFYDEYEYSDGYDVDSYGDYAEESAALSPGSDFGRVRRFREDGARTRFTRNIEDIKGALQKIMPGHTELFQDLTPPQVTEKVTGTVDAPPYQGVPLTEVDMPTSPHYDTSSRYDNITQSRFYDTPSRHDTIIQSRFYDTPSRDDDMQPHRFYNLSRQNVELPHQNDDLSQYGVYEEIPLEGLPQNVYTTEDFGFLFTPTPNNYTVIPSPLRSSHMTVIIPTHALVRSSILQPKRSTPLVPTRSTALTIQTTPRVPTRSTVKSLLPAVQRKLKPTRKGNSGPIMLSNPVTSSTPIVMRVRTWKYLPNDDNSHKDYLYPMMMDRDKYVEDLLRQASTTSPAELSSADGSSSEGISSEGSSSEGISSEGISSEGSSSEGISSEGSSSEGSSSEGISSEGSSSEGISSEGISSEDISSEGSSSEGISSEDISSEEISAEDSSAENKTATTKKDATKGKSTVIKKSTAKGKSTLKKKGGTTVPTCVWVTTTTTTTTKAPLVFDIESFLEVLANVTYDYEQNITDIMNRTLRGNIPTCPKEEDEEWVVIDGQRVKRKKSSTLFPITTTPDYETAKDINNTVIAKCFVCGLKTTGIPYDSNCADAFAGDFLPLTPVNPLAKSKTSDYRKYCRYGNVYNYYESPTKPRSIYGRWTGGCSVRWTDLTGLYTQRACRNRKRATTGLHYASKRMAKLEMSLGHTEQGCIISPVATLLPMSRGISLFARIHACVCTGNWCNKATHSQPTVTSTVLAVVVPMMVGYR